MYMEPEVILEDGELSSDEDIICTHYERPPGSSNSVSNRALRGNLEDSEIHDEIVVCTPLERPPNLTNLYKPREKSSDNDSELSSISSSDSDDFAAKKQKVKFKSKKFSKPPIKRKKKYDIWSSHIQEDVLAETLVSCEVSNMVDRSLGVEYYPHTELRHKLNAMRQGNKRRNDQRNNSNLPSQRRYDTDEEDLKGAERVILDLVTNVDNTNEEVAKDIANKLCEEKDDLIGRIVQIAGKKKSIEIFNETKRIELDGGMLVMNGKRRRTPGGVFLFLLKRDSDITNEQQKLIFTDERQEQARERKGQQKAKLKKIKDAIASKKSAVENSLPLLLSRSDLIIQKSVTLRDRNESEPEDFVNNPPPSPVTDGKENSNDGVELPSYFLESGNVVDMDIF